MYHKRSSVKERLENATLWEPQSAPCLLTFKTPMSLKMRTLQWKCKRQTMAVDHSDEGNSPANGSRSETVLAKN